MKSIYRSMLVALAVAALPSLAVAEDAFTLRPVDIYAGPDGDYPVIATLPPNTEVRVAGCLSDWSWCDVTFANDRGWIYAGELGYPYQSRRVAIIEYGPRLRLPVVTFSINSYWDAHYRSRPFFRERDQWAGRVHVEANRGGRPPQNASVGGNRAQPGQPQSAQTAPPQRAQAQGNEQRQTAQRNQREQQAQQERSRNQEAQRAQAEKRSRNEATQRAQADQQRSRQEAQRGQPAQPQANETQRPQLQARAPEGEPRAQQPQQASRGTAQERQARQREAQQNDRRPETARSAEADRRDSSKAGERPKEERSDNGQ